MHVETSYQRDMYEGQLSTAQAESAAIRKQLADCVKRYEEQSARLRGAQAGLRDASDTHHQLELKLKAAAAEKEVADDLENLLNDALRREQDKNESLEISFDVLESAYSFLARELVRTEHALEDALEVQQQLRDRAAPLYDEAESEYTVEELSEEYVTAEYTHQEHTVQAYVSRQRVEEESESQSQTTDSAYSDGDTSSWPATPGLTRSARNAATPSSVYSDGDNSSWPATPALAYSIHSAATSISSPVVTTPPLPALMLEPLPSSDSGLAKHLPPADADDFFGPTWTMDARHRVSD